MKIFKWISIIVLVLILLFVVAAICLVTLVSPNQFKSLIEEKMETTLNRKFAIKGDLSWTFIPHFGVEARQVTLNNPSDFAQPIFSEVDRMTIGVKLLPLWNKKFESDNISVEGMKLYLIKNAKGASSWDFQKKSEAVENSEIHSNHSSNSNSVPYTFSIQAINVKNSEIIWMDERSSQSFNLKNFNFKAKDISQLHSFPIHMEFDFSNKELKGHLTFNSEMALDSQANIYSFKNINSTFITSKKIECVMKGNVMVDLNQDKIKLSEFAINMDSLKTMGLIEIDDFKTNPSANGNLEIISFDLKRWLKERGVNTANMDMPKNATGEMHLNYKKSLNLKGKLNVGEVKASNLIFNKLIVEFIYDGISVSLSPEANFYEGKLKSGVSINSNKANSEINFDVKLINVDTARLMQDLGAKKLKLTGKGNFYFQGKTLTGQGNAFIKNLNGMGNFELSGGVMQGMDIAYLVKSAVTKEKTLNNTKQTPFGRVTGEYTIRQGIFINPNLVINSEHFPTEGQGQIDLVNQTILYHLQTSVSQSLLNLKGLKIPILVSGDLQDPTIGVDVGELAKLLAKHQLKKMIEAHEEGEKSGVAIPKNAGKIIKNLFGH